MKLKVPSRWLGIVKRRSTLCWLAVSTVAVIAASVETYAHLSRANPTVSLTIVQSVAEDADAQILKGLSSYLVTHPKVRVSIAYRPQVAGSVRLGSLRPNLALRAASDDDTETAVAAAEVAFADYSLLAYDKRQVASAPRSWADIARRNAEGAAEGRANPAFRLGIPAGADGIMPFLGVALWPLQQVDAAAVSREAFGLMHELTFGLGLVPKSCVAACVLQEMALGRLPYAIVNEAQIASLRSALGDALGLAGVPPLPASGTPLKSPRSVLSMLALPGANAEETAAAKDLVNSLKGDGARHLANALGKVAARNSGDSLFALVMENSVAIDLGFAESTRVFAQSLGTRFHDGELSVMAAATELMSFRSQREVTGAH